jgi:hypothetical protein
MTLQTNPYCLTKVLFMSEYANVIIKYTNILAFMLCLPLVACTTLKIQIVTEIKYCLVTYNFIQFRF